VVSGKTLGPLCLLRRRRRSSHSNAEKISFLPHRIELFSRESDRKIFVDGICPCTHTRQVLQIEYMPRWFVFFGNRDSKVNERQRAESIKTQQ